MNIKATTCNIITIGESGLIPPHVKCHENVLLNFIRLKCLPEGSVVKHVFMELETLHNIGTKCWYSRVIELGKKYGVDPTTYDYCEKKQKRYQAYL